VLRIKTKYVADSVIEQFAKGEIADAGAEGVPGQIMVYQRRRLGPSLSKDFLPHTPPYPDATTGVELQLGKDWQVYPAA